MHVRTKYGTEATLGYCANVHPGELLSSVLDAASKYGAGVRRELGVEKLSYGLWLSHAALSELEVQGVSHLRSALDEAGLFVCTLNGFPYGDFQQGIVKRRVYHPDLGTAERGSYLLRLARVLVQLLPADISEGTISTLPIGHRQECGNGDELMARAARNLCHLAEDLAWLREQTGRSVRICLEPEPGCWLETTADVIHFFSETLPRVAIQLGTPRDLLSQHLGVCYDTCHHAVCFENPEQSISNLTSAGVRIGKAQLSSALELTQPRDETARAELMAFDDGRYLHQVRARLDDGRLAEADDLSETARLPTDRPHRVHFHVPIHHALLGRITTTRPFLERALLALAKLHPLPHLEVETYTWSVLPELQRPRTELELVHGLVQELRWAEGVLS